MENRTDLSNQEVEKVIKDFIKDYFVFRQNLKNENVVENIDEQQLKKVKTMTIPKRGRSLEEVTKEMNESIYKYGYNVNHPRYFGFIPGPSSTLSLLGDVMTSAYNRHAGSWTTFPAGCHIENELIQWLCQQANYPKSASGVFVSGGSMANMTALTIARDTILKEDQWHKGVAYVSNQTHSSVAKGLRIIGIVNSSIRIIETDKNFCMNVDQLEEMIKKDKENGLIPFVIIASAGTTNTGSIDDFEKISKLCQKYHMWMHADGAFGASVLLSKKHKDLLKGIEKADSISWDGHKWLFQTYACGIVLVKEKRQMLKSFSVHPEYLQDLEMDETYFNPWDMSMELTRPARGLKLWLTLQVMGSDAISDAIDHGFEIADIAEKQLQKCKDIEFISHSHMGIVNFRFSPENYSNEEKDKINHEISMRIVNSGYAGVFTTQLQGKTVLRICSLHPETTKEDIVKTISKLEMYYREIMK